MKRKFQNYKSLPHFIPLTLIFAFSALPAASLRDSIEIFQRQLDSTQKKFEELQFRFEELSKREKVSLARLEAIQEKILLTERLLRQLQTQIGLRNREINEISMELAKIQENIQKKRAELSRRLISIYKYSRIYPLQALLTSQNLPELYRRAYNLRLVSRTDRKLILQLQQLNQQALAKRDELISAKRELELLLAENREKETRLVLDREEEQALLRKIQKEKEANQKAQEELTTARERLLVLIADLEKREQELASHSSSLSATGFEKEKGELPWPIQGSVIAGFGTKTHPRYHTRTTNLGVDIKPNNPGPVVAVAPGKVVYADRFIGYGNLVIVDHGGGYYTLYANLSQIQTVVGAQLEKNNVLGFVEDYLHFEIRHEGKPLDPLKWLK